MTSTEREEFFGPSPALSRAIAKVESGKTRTLLGAAMLVAFVAVMRLGGDDPVDHVKLVAPVAVLILGLYHVIGGPLQARRYKSDVLRLTAAPPADVLWYTLTDEGLVVHADMKLDLGEGGLAAPWTAMETLTRMEGAHPVLRLTYRLASAAKSAAHQLGMDRKRADGVLFGDRMQARFDARRAGAPSPLSQGGQGIADPQSAARADALADLKATWRAQPAAGRWVTILGVAALVVSLVSGGLGLIGGKRDASDRPAQPAPPVTAPPVTNMILDNPPSLSIEQGEPDPAGILRRIAAGGSAGFGIGYSWIGILEEQPLDKGGGAAGRIAQFEWNRHAATWTTITVFESLQQAEAADRQLSGGETRDILMPNPDGVTQYVQWTIPSPDGARSYPMRCAARPKLFYCSIVPEGVPAIVTVKFRIDTEAGPEPGAREAKGVELAEAMGRETDEVMRSLGGLGLDGRRAVAR
jgi:hypothetical protein